MYCPHCQANNPETARFCLNCGQELLRKCPNCQTEYPQGAHYCMACGQSILVENNDDSQRFSRLIAAVPRTLEQKMRLESKTAGIPQPGSFGERRTVTTLLADVVGSTALAKELDLETWMEMMNQAFDHIAPVIYRYEGTIARLLGDSLLAFFGAPVAHEDDPLRAVRAGLDIITQIGAYSREVKEIHGLEFGLRVCINTGPVEIGPIGDDLSYDYTAFGGTVNLTSRIKFAGAPMSVLITGNTYPFVAPYFYCQDLDTVEVKGMEEAVRVYLVQSPRAKPGQTRGFAELASPLVGRDRELATLLHVCEAVRAGMGRAVVIVGEPGLGKTRLIQEWQKKAKADGHVLVESDKKLPTGRWVTGRCISYGQGLAYQLLISVVKDLIGVTETSDEPETHRALQTMTKDLFGNQMMEVYPYLGHLLSLKLEGEALLRAQITDPLVLRTHYLMAVQRILQTLMRERPLVLVLEDLHWSDASSTELFMKLLPLVSREPILFCLVTRPEHDSPGWKLVTAARELMGSSLTEIGLASLTETDSRTLVSNLLEIESLPKPVREIILSKAEGNPYFVEEVIRMLIDHGVILHQDGTWIAQREITEYHIPDNLQGLLLARIDRLPTESRQTLLVASVIGRNFRERILSQIIKGVRPLSRELYMLESSGLIQMTSTEPDLEYTFRHSLVQDAAYALLLPPDRKQLHLSVGEAIERLYPERKKELAASLGYHFKEAGQEKHALDYFFMAGENALAAYANQEAEDQYRHALKLTCLSQDESARLYSGLGEALDRQDREDEALQAFNTGIDIYKSLGDFDGIGRLYSRAARVVWYMGDRPGSLQVCLDGMELVKDAPESQGKAALIHETARGCYFTGRSDKALPLCRQALAMAEKLGAVNVQADSLATLGILDGIPIEEKMDALLRAIEVAESHGMLGLASRAHINLGVILSTWKADNQASSAHYSRAAELDRLRGEALQELWALQDNTSCLFRAGKIKEVRAVISYMEELVSKIPNKELFLLQLTIVKAFLMGVEGNVKTAKNMLYEALKEMQVRKNLELELILTKILSDWLFPFAWFGDLADLDEIEILLKKAVQIVDPSDSSDKIWVYPRMSMLRARQCRFDEAREWQEKALQVSQKMPSAWDEYYQWQCEAEIAAGKQDWTNALKAMEKVCKLEQEMDFRLPEVISLLTLADLHIRRGEPADLESAQTLLSEDLAALYEMGMGYFPEIAKEMLQKVQTRLHAQTLDHELLTKELKKARRVQESLLPEKPPEISGWDLAVSLEPAHETSGDFYDFLLLKDGRLGLVIADVTDKGTSAALFMALSRSLWRTFAIDHPDEPELTMAETNRRILADTHGGLFITLFYGILNPQDGSFTYCSAGHHPAFLVRAKDGAVEQLERTGIPLGVYADVSWDKGSLKIEPGEALVLYTDGITDAQNPAEEFFSLERLQELLKTQSGKPAGELHKTILSEVHTWMGEAPQFDDITLLVVSRE